MPTSRRAALASAAAAAPPGPVRIAHRGDQALAQARHDLLAEGDQVAALGLELVEDGDPGERRRQSARASTNRSTASVSARPRRSRTTPRVIGSSALPSTWSSIDSASRMPPAAQVRDELERLGLDGPALGFEDPLELAADLCLGAAAGT